MLGHHRHLVGETEEGPHAPAQQDRHEHEEPKAEPSLWGIFAGVDVHAIDFECRGASPPAWVRASCRRHGPETAQDSNRAERNCPPMPARPAAPSFRGTPRVLLILAIMIQIALCLVTLERRDSPVPMPPKEPPTSLVQKQAGAPATSSTALPVAPP